jgi:hypothetical protein
VQNKDLYLPPKAELGMVELLLAHPQVDPNLGLTEWASTPDGCFTRKSPLMAALMRLLDAKRGTMACPGRKDKLVSWNDAALIVQALVAHQSIDMEYGRHTRHVDVKEDVRNTPVFELLSECKETNVLLLDAVLLLVMYGAKLNPESKLLLEHLLGAAEKEPGVKLPPAMIPTKEFLERHEAEYEVDDDYEEVRIPAAMRAQWDTSNNLSAYRLRSHYKLWGIGWRPESHAYFPKPFRTAAKTLLLCTKRMQRYTKDKSEKTRKMIKLDLEGKKFLGLGDRIYPFKMRRRDAKALIAQWEIRNANNKAEIVVGEGGSFCELERNELNDNCVPLALQFSDHAVGVKLVSNMQGVFVYDYTSFQVAEEDASLRHWQWKMVKHVEIDADKELNSELVESTAAYEVAYKEAREAKKLGNEKAKEKKFVDWGEITRLEDKADKFKDRMREAQKTLSGKDNDELVQLGYVIQDEEGLPNAGRFVFYCPSDPKRMSNGGAKMIEQLVTENNEHWLEAMAMRLTMLKKLLEEANEEVAKLQKDGHTSGSTDLGRAEQQGEESSSHSYTHTIIHALIRPFIHSYDHSCTHTIIHALIRPFMH